MQDQPVKLAIVMKVIGRTGSRGQVRITRFVAQAETREWIVFIQACHTLLSTPCCLDSHYY